MRGVTGRRVRGRRRRLTLNGHPGLGCAPPRPFLYQVAVVGVYFKGYALAVVLDTGVNGGAGTGKGVKDNAVFGAG